MADVGLDRAEGAEAPVLREMAKGLAQGGEFDGVAEGRPGAVAFDKAESPEREIASPMTAVWPNSPGAV